MHKKPGRRNSLGNNSSGEMNTSLCDEKVFSGAVILLMSVSFCLRAGSSIVSNDVWAG